MKDILSSKDLRLLKITEYIIDHPTCTLTEISSVTNISVRTISTSIAKINDLIAPCKIETDYMGIKLTMTNNNSPRHILNQFLSLSLELNILESIFRNPYTTVMELASKYYVSDHTIRRSITHINKYLKDKSFQISLPYLKFEGDLQSASMFFIIFLGEKYHFVDDMMNQHELLALRHILDHTSLFEGQIKNKQDYSRLLLWAYVKTMFYINYDLEQAVSLKYDVSAFDEAVRLFLIAFNTQPTQNLLNYAFSFISRQSFAINFEHAQLQAKTNTLWTDHLRNLVVFVETLKKDLQLDLENSDLVLTDLFNMLRFPLDYSNILYSRDATFLKSFSNEYPSLYQSTRYTLENTFKGTLNEEQINALLYILLSHWSLLLKSIKSKDNTLKVGIFTDSDKEHAILIQEIVESSFSTRLEVEVIETIFLNNLRHIMNRLDLLITTIPNIVHNDCDVICFSEYPSPENWSILYRSINKILINK